MIAEGVPRSVKCIHKNRPWHGRQLGAVESVAYQFLIAHSATVERFAYVKH